MDIIVDDFLTLLDKEKTWKTRVWASDGVIKEILQYSKKGELHKGTFIKNLSRYAETGFDLWIGNEKPIRTETGYQGIYRIGGSSLFRVCGFFENNTKANFIALEAFLKKGQSLTRPQKERLQRLVTIRESGNWKKKVKTP